MKKIIPQAIKNIYHLGQAILANVYFGFPSRKITVIGITGTNGKTTTCQMVAKILEETGFSVAMASTINFKLGEKEWVNKTKFTTLSSWQVQKFIAQVVKKGCKYLVLETSSHSLDQNRVWGVQYRTAVITNITREHLDYHKTMEEYRKAKISLFRRAEVAIINLDMEKPEDFLQLDYEKTLTYSLKNEEADVFAKEIELETTGSQFKMKDLEFSLNLPGEFNIENALAAIGVGMTENIPLGKIKTAIEKIKGVSGRLEFIPNQRGFNIMIDYAVTPDSLEKLYALIEKINREKTRVIAVFGACGERDRGKRPLMGEIVARQADYIILTNEDPYDEDPEQILQEIKSGIKNKILNQNLWEIMERREAIKKALYLAKPKDFIIITGKGAEEVMAIGKERIPWNDKKVIERLLQEL